MIFKKGQILLIKHKIDPIGFLIRKYQGFDFDHTVFVLSSKRGISMGAFGATYDKLNKFKNKRWYDYIVLDFDIDNLEEKVKKMNKLACKPNLWKWFTLFYDMIALMINKECKKKILPRIAPICSEFVYKNIFCYSGNWEGIIPLDLYERFQCEKYPIL